MHPAVLQTTIRSLKKGFVKQSWWNLVQDDVKKSLTWTIDHIDLLGSSFRDAFVAGFKLEHKRRFLHGQKTKQSSAFKHTAEAVLGSAITREAYECGKLPCHGVLSLYDFIDPNYADIQACIFLCHQVDILEQMGILTEEANIEPSTDKMIQLLKDLARIDGQLRKRKSTDDFETIYWDFDDESSGQNTEGGVE